MDLPDPVDGESFRDWYAGQLLLVLAGRWIPRGERGWARGGSVTSEVRSAGDAGSVAIVAPSVDL
jgi:hypothetical protein